MATGSKKDSQKSDAWLLAGTGSRRKRRRRTGTANGDSDQWLAVPRPSKAATRGSKSKRDPRPIRPTTRPKAAALPAQAARRERSLEAKLRRALEEIEAQKAEIAELRAEIAKVRGGGGTRPAAARGRKAPPRGKVGLDVATFEQLREVGLSATQAARVIAARDLDGGFQRWEELDRIPGLSKATRRKLRDELRLRSG